MYRIYFSYKYKNRGGVELTENDTVSVEDSSGPLKIEEDAKNKAKNYCKQNSWTFLRLELLKFQPQNGGLHG